MSTIASKVGAFLTCTATLLNIRSLNHHPLLLFIQVARLPERACARCGL